MKNKKQMDFQKKIIKEEYVTEKDIIIRVRKLLTKNKIKNADRKWKEKLLKKDKK
ncbi:hypothetical protein [Peribacillus muralis]|uniref:hypothetical protein n=1 Tax=Peribacillus muralis TaxID=264697 RepID=UPI000A9DF1BE|nr:hypothetical protein [Peribacillus muralis]